MSAGKVYDLEYRIQAIKLANENRTPLYWRKKISRVFQLGLQKHISFFALALL